MFCVSNRMTNVSFDMGFLHVSALDLIPCVNPIAIFTRGVKADNTIPHDVGVQNNEKTWTRRHRGKWKVYQTFFISVNKASAWTNQDKNMDEYCYCPLFLLLLGGTQNISHKQFLAADGQREWDHYCVFEPPAAAFIAVYSSRLQWSLVALHQAFC